MDFDNAALVTDTASLLVKLKADSSIGRSQPARPQKVRAPLRASKILGEILDWLATIRTLFDVEWIQITVLLVVMETGNVDWSFAMTAISRHTLQRSPGSC